jgi:ribose-phosphate pyrophosphokinase
MNGTIIAINHFNLAKKISKNTGLVYAKINHKNFPDKESHINIPCRVKGQKVFVLVDYSQAPDELLSISFLISETLKRLGAKKVFLIAPYLIYMRQDKEFVKGDVISAPIVCKLISKQFDGIITIDPHLHRIHSLKPFFGNKVSIISATKTLGEFLKKKKEDFVLVGPDEESKQWVKKVANISKNEFVVATKKRLGSRKVKVSIEKKGIKLNGRKVIIIDDIISTGHTILESIKGLKKEKVSEIECYCIHGIFAENALKKIKKAKVKAYSSNTISNSISKIDVSKIISEKVIKWI